MLVVKGIFILYLGATFDQPQSVFDLNVGAGFSICSEIYVDCQTFFKCA